MSGDPRLGNPGLRGSRLRAALPVLSSLTLVSVTFSLGYLWSEELWWYLASGHEILASGAIPEFDRFVYALPEPAAWATHSWLWTVILAALHDYIGLAALPALSAVLGATFVTLLFTRARLDRFALVNGILVSLVLLVAMNRFALRAELPGWILFVAYIARFEGGRPLGWRSVALLCGAQWLWSNLHGGYILGILAALSYAAGDTVESRFAGRAASKAPGRRTGGDRVPLWLPPLLLLASVLTPDLALDRIETLRNVVSQAFANTTSEESLIVGEWQSLLTAELGRPRAMFGILFGVGISSFFARPGSRRASRLLLFAGMAVLAVIAVRFLVGFAIASAFVTMKNLDDARNARADWPAWMRHPVARGLYVTSVVLFCATATAASAALWQSRSRFEVGQSADHGFSLSPRYTCPGAAEYIRDNHLAGPIFNEMPLGGYLVHRLYPEHSVFIDGRLLDLRHLRRATRALYLPEEWRSLDAEYGFKIVVLSNLIRPALPLRRQLAADRDWQLAYVDPQALVFVRGRDPIPRVHLLSGRDGEGKSTPFRISSHEVAERWRTAVGELLLDDAPRFLLANYLQALTDLGKSIEVDAMASDFLTSQPGASRVRAIRGRARLRLGRPQEALDDFESVLAKWPDDIATRLNYVQALHRTGRTDLARIEFDRVRDFDATLPEIATVERELSRSTGPR